MGNPLFTLRVVTHVNKILPMVRETELPTGMKKMEAFH